MKERARELWEKIGFKDHHGIAVPLFSLWTEDSAGIGEYLDLIPLIDWCADIGFDVIQLLPLNDLGDGKSPYSALSAFALNPNHLKLKFLSKHPKKALIDYAAVSHEKEAFLRQYFKKVGPDIMQEPDFVAFKKKNPWLSDYACFKAFKKPQDQSYYEFVQFLCFQQMEQVKNYATKKGIMLKGDIPILLSPSSADVFWHKDLFIHHLTAGAPPDYYSEEGQSWGFPIYNWDHDYDKIMRWWKERLRVSSHLYHLYRLDHVVGLFRIYAIPENKKAKDGFFIPSESEEWLPQGTHILESFLKDCPMLPIAEDLGVVPPNIKNRLIELGIPGTKVLRWETDPNDNNRYLPVSSYPKISMTTVSTHDTETLKEWWHTFPKLAQAFCEANDLGFREKFDHTMRQEILTLSHRSNSLFHINQFQEYFPEEFENESTSRINHPGKPERDENWAVMWPHSLEEILSNDALKQMCRHAIS